MLSSPRICSLLLACSLCSLLSRAQTLRSPPARKDWGGYTEAMLGPFIDPSTPRAGLPTLNPELALVTTSALPADTWLREEEEEGGPEGGRRIRATMSARFKSANDTLQLAVSRCPLPIAHVDMQSSVGWSTSAEV